MTEPNPAAVTQELGVSKEPQTASKISINDLSKIEVRIGTVRAAERVPETEKLLKCSVDFGEASGPRTIVSGIARQVKDPSELVGKQFAYVTNLAPRVIKGIESNGMLFAVGTDDAFAFLVPSKEVPPGTSAH